MSGKVTRGLLSASLLVFLAGCSSSSNSSDALDVGQQAAQQQAVTPVVQANCPAVVMPHETAIHRTYARGAKDDPSKIVYQASLADSTRSCIASGENLVVNVVVQGRLIGGPEGRPGNVTLPIRVTVTDGAETLFTELTRLDVNLPAETLSTQFLYNNDRVTIPNAPGGAGRYVRVVVGFDDGTSQRR